MTDEPDDLDEKLFALRVSGKTERAVAKVFGVKVRRVREAIERMAMQIDHAARRRELVVELHRIDALHERFFKIALEDGDVQAAVVTLKLSERRSSLWAWDHAPQRLDQPLMKTIEPVLQPTSTSRILHALNQIAATRPPAPAPVLEPEPAEP